MNDPQVFGEIIRQSRKTAGITQEELARKAGISKAYVGTIENARPHTLTGAISRPDRDVAIRIISALNDTLPSEERLNMADTLNVIGYTPPDGLAASKRGFAPQNVAEFFQALDDLGLDIQLDGGVTTLAALDADDLQELLDSLVAQTVAKAKRKRAKYP